MLKLRTELLDLIPLSSAQLELYLEQPTQLEQELEDSNLPSNPD